jgi:hypothetical protein
MRGLSFDLADGSGPFDSTTTEGVARAWRGASERGDCRPAQEMTRAVIAPIQGRFDRQVNMLPLALRAAPGTKDGPSLEGKE